MKENSIHSQTEFYTSIHDKQHCISVIMANDTFSRTASNDPQTNTFVAIFFAEFNYPFLMDINLKESLKILFSSQPHVKQFTQKSHESFDCIHSVDRDSICSAIFRWFRLSRRIWIRRSIFRIIKLIRECWQF